MMTECLQRRSDNGDPSAKRYARRRLGVMLAGWIIGPVLASFLTLGGFWFTKWYEVMIVTHETPLHTAENKNEIRALTSSVNKMREEIAALQSDIKRVFREHDEIRKTDDELKAEQKALWHLERRRAK